MSPRAYARSSSWRKPKTRSGQWHLVHHANVVLWGPRRLHGPLAALHHHDHVVQLVGFFSALPYHQFCPLVILLHFFYRNDHLIAWASNVHGKDLVEVAAITVLRETCAATWHCESNEDDLYVSSILSSTNISAINTIVNLHDCKLRSHENYIGSHESIELASLLTKKRIRCGRTGSQLRKIYNREGTWVDSMIPTFCFLQ
jgi:hypothetical protein